MGAITPARPDTPVRAIIPQVFYGGRSARCRARPASPHRGRPPAAAASAACSWPARSSFCGFHCSSSRALERRRRASKTIRRPRALIEFRRSANSRPLEEPRPGLSGAGGKSSAGCIIKWAPSLKNQLSAWRLNFFPRSSPDKGGRANTIAAVKRSLCCRRRGRRCCRRQIARGTAQEDLCK